MNVYLADRDWAPHLANQLVDGQRFDDVWVTSTAPIQDTTRVPFARQMLPDARLESAASINAWAKLLTERLIGELPNHPPWRLHLWAAYGDPSAGAHRIRLIEEALRERLKKQRRHLLRNLGGDTRPFEADEALVQVALTSPTEGWVSILPPPEAWRHRGLVSPFPTGQVPIAEDKSAPSRAFAKLVEAELRLGQRIEAGQTVVDLGASPGSWSYVALQRGAKVTAVDRSPLRDDLMKDSRLAFVEGDAFNFKPPSRVNWLICDVIAAPERSAQLLSNWLNASWMDHFIVTLKFKGTDDYALLDSVTEDLMPLCREWRLSRLCANKNEVTAFGSSRLSANC